MTQEGWGNLTVFYLDQNGDKNANHHPNNGVVQKVRVLKESCKKVIDKKNNKVMKKYSNCYQNCQQSKYSLVLTTQASPPNHPKGVS